MTRRSPRPRSAYTGFMTIPTRWNDNDLYGHVYQGTYIELFDCAVNDWLVRENGIDLHTGDPTIVVVENTISYFREVSYPDRVEVGFRLESLGGASLRLGLGMFREGGDEECAQMASVLVNVTKDDHRPQPWSDTHRAMWQRLEVAEKTGG